MFGLFADYLTPIFSAACPRCHANTFSWWTASAMSSGVGAVRMTTWRIVLRHTACTSRAIRRTSRAIRCSRTKKKKPIRRGQLFFYRIISSLWYGCNNKYIIFDGRYEFLKTGKKRFSTDGLANLQYELSDKRKPKLYTWLLVKLTPPQPSWWLPWLGWRLLRTKVYLLRSWCDCRVAKATPLELTSHRRNKR